MQGIETHCGIPSEDVRLREEVARDREWVQGWTVLTAKYSWLSAQVSPVITLLQAALSRNSD